MFKYVKSIIFVLNSEYDTAQLRGIAGVPCFPPNCSDDMMKFIDNFREVKIDDAQVLIAIHFCL